MLERQPAQKKGPLGRIRVQLQNEVNGLSGEVSLAEILLLVDHVFQKMEAVGYEDTKGNAQRLEGRRGVGAPFIRHGQRQKA